MIFEMERKEQRDTNMVGNDKLLCVKQAGTRCTAYHRHHPSKIPDHPIRSCTNSTSLPVFRYMLSPRALVGHRGINPDARFLRSSVNTDGMTRGGPHKRQVISARRSCRLSKISTQLTVPFKWPN